MNEKVERFEDLWIWQEAPKLVNDIYGDFREGSGARDFGFQNQIQDAAISVMNNIAEGFERKTDAEFGGSSISREDLPAKFGACTTLRKT